MSGTNELVQRYLAVWNEDDAAKRSELITQTWTDDASYRDPLMQGEGHSGIETLVQGVHTQFPGFRFRQVGTADGYGSYVRFAWELGPEHGAALVGGTDVGTLASDGRLQSVIGFIDFMPTGGAA